MDFSAKLQGMFARCVRNMIYKLRDRVWPLELGPLEAAKAWEEVTAKPNARQPSGKRTTHPRIQTVGGSRRVDVATQRRLIKTVVYKSRFVCPTLTLYPTP